TTAFCERPAGGMCGRFDIVSAEKESRLGGMACLVSRSLDGEGRARMSRYASGASLVALVLSCPGFAPAADDARALAFFEAKTRPVLGENCYQCHSARAGKSAGGLKPDTKKAIRAGGDRGPAAVPGDPKASLLLTAVSHTDPDLKMPPKKPRLPD